MTSAIATKVISLVGKHHYRSKRIALDSEIYYDLLIYGQELEDMFDELSSNFGVDFSQIDQKLIAPSEGFEPINWILVNVGFRPFRSFTVSDIANFVSTRIAMTGSELR